MEHSISTSFNKATKEKSKLGKSVSKIFDKVRDRADATLLRAEIKAQATAVRRDSARWRAGKSYREWTP